MIRPTAYCDHCGIGRKEGNHWFVAWLRTGAFYLYQWDVAPKSAPGKAQKRIHLCSESCAVKAMSKAIGTSQEEPRQ